MLELNKLYLGDSFELIRDVPDKSIDMILEDLPYGITACAFDKPQINAEQIAFLNWLKALKYPGENQAYLDMLKSFVKRLFKLPIDLVQYWESRKRIIKDNGAIVLTGSQPFTSLLVISWLDGFKYEWIWDKGGNSNFMNLKVRPFKVQEQVLIFSKDSCFTFNPIRVFRSESSLKRFKIGEKAIVKCRKSDIKSSHYSNCRPQEHQLAFDGKKHPIDIIKIQSLTSGRYKIKHPSKKPIELFQYLIRTYTSEGDTVFDGFAGSGTTAIAAMNTNRKWICIEKDPKYFQTASTRIEDRVKAPTFFDETLPA
jgi:site-specific DNA-methyltransferase (adenine-specific)